MTPRLFTHLLRTPNYWATAWPKTVFFQS